MNLKLKNKIVIYLIIGLPAIISILYNIYVANNLAVSGIKLSKLESNIKQMEFANKELSLEIAKYSDYNRVLERAVNLGMSSNGVSFITLPDTTLAGYIPKN